MKRINVNICALLVLILAACTKSDVVDPVPTPSNTITFSASDMQLEVITRGGDKRPTTLDMANKSIVSEDGESSLPMVVKVEEGIHRAIEQKPETRAAAVTDANQISMLSAWASAKKSDVSELYINDVDFTKGSDGIFRSNPAKLWLDAQTTLDFFVVANHIKQFTPNFNAAGDHIISFDYTVPTDAANQPDLLVAEKLDIAGNYEESVPLDFKHVLAAVNIKVGSEVATTGTIQSIKFKGVYNKGTYLLDEHQWVNRTIEDNVVFNVPLPEGGVAITKGEGEGVAVSTTSFMMIPQQLATGAEVEVIFHNNTLNKDVTLRASIQGDVWAMNTTTNYLININANNGLEIIPLDKVIDSHYVITKVEISSEYTNWSLSVEANDKSDVTIQLEQDVNPMAKQGFWTDKIAIRNGTEYVITENSARGSNEIDGSGKGAISDQVVYVFIPENVLSGEDRKITLKFSGWGANILEGSYKELTLTQSPVKWLDPTGESNPDLFWGCELLIEGGQVPWGFCWTGVSETFRISQGGGSDHIPHGQLKNKIMPAMENSGLDYKNFPSYVSFIPDPKNSCVMLDINYEQLATVIHAGESMTDGYKNTMGMYKFESKKGIGSMGIDLIIALKAFVQTVPDAEYVTGSGPVELASLDNYAALNALKRNRFHLYADVTNDMYIPILNDNDANWYLPAKEQYENAICKASWGQEFTWNDYYWTSSIYPNETEPDKDTGMSYIFSGQTSTPAPRLNNYLTMAIRRKTSTADIVIKPENVIIPGGGDNGGENGTIPGTGNQGGDIVTP